MQRRNFLLSLLLAAFFISSVHAQKPARALAANVTEHQLTSKLMGRDMPYRVIVPTEKMVATGARYPVLYLLHGLTGHYNNWTDLTKVSDYAASYKLIIVMPEGGDGWYTDSVSNDKEKWESYIIQELIPEVDKKFRTLATRDKRAIAGLSMGGFGSLKFGLKYPEKFVLAGSFSGALGAAQITEKTVPGAIGKTIDGIFGPDGSDSRKANDLFALVRSLTPEKAKEIPFIYFDCGTEDFLFQSNRDFLNLMVEKKVPHEYRQLPGVHDWKYWDKQVQEFLRLADRFFSKDSVSTGFFHPAAEVGNTITADQIRDLPPGKIPALELVGPRKP